MNERAGHKKDVLREHGSSRITHLRGSAGLFSFPRTRNFAVPGKLALTEEQQHALIKLVREGNADARRKMLGHHMHLVVDFARHYSNRGPAPLDLIRAGSQGLARAVEKFEPSGSSSFTAFAAWCICEDVESEIRKWHNLPDLRSSPAVDRHAAASPVRGVLRSRRPMAS